MSSIAQVLSSLGANGQKHLLHLIIIGQSNGYGQDAIPSLTTSTPVGCKMFNAGLFPGGSSLTSLINLAEADHGSGAGETVASTIATRLVHSSLGSVPFNTQLLVSDVSVNGTAYDGLKKGTTAYNNSIAQVTAAKSLATAAGLTYRVLGFAVLHGEQDQLLNNIHYEADLVTWQSDYETDIKAITSQSQSTPFFVCQQAGYPASTGPGPSTAFTVAKIALDHPGLFYCVAPRYPYDHKNGVHLYNWAQRWHGEIYGKVIAQVMNGGTWPSFQPSAVTRSGTVITIDLMVPVPPIQLAFDRVLFQANYGFTFADDDSSATVSSVAITGASQIQVTLDGVPTGANETILYGYQGGASNDNSPNYDGGRGNIKDSDVSLSLFGLPMENYLANFSWPVS